MINRINDSYDIDREEVEELVIRDCNQESVSMVTISQFDWLVQTLFEKKVINQKEVDKIYKGE